MKCTKNHFKSPQQASVPLVLFDCTLSECGIVPFCYLSALSLSFLFLSLSGKASFYTCLYLIFFPPPFYSSCDSYSIKWPWQQQQYKQLSYILNSIQAANQKVKWREVHQPLQNSESCHIFFFENIRTINQKDWASTSFLFFKT